VYRDNLQIRYRALSKVLKQKGICLQIDGGNSFKNTRFSYSDIESIDVIKYTLWI